MSDLIERLKALPWHEPAIAEAIDALDAKDQEIERLEAQLESLQNKWANRELSEPDSQARIAELEDALEQIRDGQLATSDAEFLAAQALGKRDD